MDDQKNALLQLSESDVKNMDWSYEPEKPKRKPNNNTNKYLLAMLIVAIATFIVIGTLFQPSPDSSTADLYTKVPQRPTPTEAPLLLSLKAEIKELPGVVNVDCVGEHRGERQGFFASVTIHSDSNGESFATQLKTHVIELETTLFAVRIDDTKSERLWWDYKGNSEWSSSKEPPNWTTGC